MEVLRRLGLSGAYQCHCPPTVLVPDERAHQVFTGFGPDTGTVLTRFLPRYGVGAAVWILAEDGDASLSSLSEALLRPWGPGSTAVLPATQSDRAGGLYGLVQVVDRLLGPGGCPWDQEQTHATLKRHLVEETYELIDAIDSGDDEKMAEELGDVLLQPIMHSQMEALAGQWDIDRVASLITEKLVRRHPHVFGETQVADADEVLKNWDAIKRSERSDEASILATVPRALPALSRAYEVSKRAARAGFEWPDIEGVWTKLEEEERELKEAVASSEGVSDEIGDILFTVVNLARWLKVDPEDALRTMVDRFSNRFKAMEGASDRPLGELTPSDWDDLWNLAKGR